MLVRVEQPFLAVLVEHRDRLDLPFESTFVDRPDRLSVGPQGELVHLFPGDVILVGHQVGRDALLDDLVLLQQFRAQDSRIGSEGHARHRLDPARDHDVGLAGHDLHRGEVESLQSRGAHPVHARARDGLRESGDQGREAPDVQALLVDLGHAAEDDVLDQLGLDPRAVDERPQREGGQVVRPPVLQGPAPLPDGRAYGPHDHSLSHRTDPCRPCTARNKKVFYFAIAKTR